jgi:hypothetical protein
VTDITSPSAETSFGISSTSSDPAFRLWMSRPFPILEPFASFEEEHCFLAGECILSLVLPLLLLWRQMAHGEPGEVAFAHGKITPRLRHLRLGCNAHWGIRALDDDGLELFDFAPDLFFALAKPLL